MRNLFFSLLFFVVAQPVLASPLQQLERDRAFLDKATGSQETLNKVTLLHLGKVSRPARLDLIRGAKRSLLISVPYWFDDVSGKETFDTLENALERNPRLEARVLKDWTSPGSTKDLFAVRMSLRLKRLTDGFLLWNPPWWLRRFSKNIFVGRLHDKMIVADGEKLLMGGMNIGDMYLEGGLTRKGWHDTDLLIEGPAAAEAAVIYTKVWQLGRHFLSLGHFPSMGRGGWEFLADYFYRGRESLRFVRRVLGLPREHEIHIPVREQLRILGVDSGRVMPAPGGVPLRLVYDNPLLQRGEAGACNFQCVLARLLKATERSARFYIPYLTITEEFEDLLVRTAKRGVKVEILTNSVLSHDIGQPAYWAAFNHYPALLAAGVRIHEWRGHKPLLAMENRYGCEIPRGYWPGNTVHTKAVILDGEVGIVGSHNMNKRSQSLNSELMAVVADRGFAAELNAVFEDDILGARREAPCGRGRVSLPPRTREMKLAEARELYPSSRGKVRFYKLLENFF